MERSQGAERGLNKKKEKKRKIEEKKEKEERERKAEESESKYSSKRAHRIDAQWETYP